MDVLCDMVDRHGRFGGYRCLHLQGKNREKIEAAYSVKRSCPSTKLHEVTSEKTIFIRCQNLKLHFSGTVRKTVRR
jgi:ribosomal protein L37AE/L43A